MLRGEGVGVCLETTRYPSLGQLRQSGGGSRCSWGWGRQPEAAGPCERAEPSAYRHLHDKQFKICTETSELVSRIMDAPEKDQMRFSHAVCSYRTYCHSI